MNFPYGKFVTAVPPDFAPPECWPEYSHITDPAALCNREEVGENPQGIRWSLWPLCLEEYVGDIEPDLEKSKEGNLARNRVIKWLRVSRSDIPKGWYPVSRKPSRIDGFYKITGGQDTTEGWNKNAQRDLRIWQESFLNKQYSIEEISFDRYSVGYKKSTIAKKIGLERLHTLREKLNITLTKAHTKLYAVANVQTKEIIAGSAVIFSPTSKSATHFAPFVRDEGRHVNAATALVHHWFAHAQQKNCNYVVTTNFWYPGKPTSWKGFSEFKSHFGFQYIAYPPELVRFVRGTLF